MNRLICTLVALAAVAVAPAAAQAKVVRTGNRCSYTSDKVSPPPICGISAPEVLYGYESDNPEGGNQQDFGFKVTGRVTLGMVIHMPKVLDGDVLVTKRPNAGQGQGRKVGSLITTRSQGGCQERGVVCGSEKLNLGRGIYSIVVEASTRDSVPLTSYSIAFTATPSGLVHPYVYGLDCPGDMLCPIG